MKNKTFDMVYIALFAVVMAICSWITIPMAVPFTLQTFGVFLAAGVLGGKRGTFAILIYLFMGAIGLPVFSGFTGGIGCLFGSTGGYLMGFVFLSLIMWGAERLFGQKTWVLWLSMIIGLIVCYAVGTIWFMAVYAKNSGSVGVITVLGWCVFPFVIPDLLKRSLALLVRKRLLKVMR